MNKKKTNIFKLEMSDDYGDYLGLQPPDTTSIKFAPDFISEMTSADLRLLQNELFARHGYIFKSKDLVYLSKMFKT